MHACGRGSFIVNLPVSEREQPSAFDDRFKKFGVGSHIESYMHSANSGEFVSLALPCSISRVTLTHLSASTGEWFCVVDCDGPTESLRSVRSCFRSVLQAASATGSGRGCTHGTHEILELGHQTSSGSSSSGSNESPFWFVASSCRGCPQRLVCFRLMPISFKVKASMLNVGPRAHYHYLLVRRYQGRPGNVFLQPSNCLSDQTEYESQRHDRGQQDRPH